jgi:hypothetical protein
MSPLFSACRDCGHRNEKGLDGHQDYGKQNDCKAADKGNGCVVTDVIGCMHETALLHLEGALGFRVSDMQQGRGAGTSRSGSKDTLITLPLPTGSTGSHMTCADIIAATTQLPPRFGTAVLYSRPLATTVVPSPDIGPMLTKAAITSCAPLGPGR